MADTEMATEGDLRDVTEEEDDILTRSKKRNTGNWNENDKGSSREEGGVVEGSVDVKVKALYMDSFLGKMMRNLMEERGSMDDGEIYDDVVVEEGKNETSFGMGMTGEEKK